jgi:Na+/H+ antiporter NhaD/arsenite permease-like protein
MVEITGFIHLTLKSRAYLEFLRGWSLEGDLGRLSSDIIQQLDLPVYLSLAFLFGIASQFRAMDGESFLRRITASFAGKIGLLYAVVVVTSLFSPLILNDVVILILTPVLIRYAKQFKVDIAPLLVAEITFTNIASSLTPLGNPQNILLWTASKSTFLQFVEGTWVPLLISACIAAVALLPMRRQLGGDRESPALPGSTVPGFYLALVVVALIVSDLSGLATYLSLGACFVLGFSFTLRSLRKVVQNFDLRSILILYVFVGSISVASVFVGPALSGYAAPVAAGVQPYSALFVGGLSNLISNVPATQLVLSVTSVSPRIASKIAVEAGLAGNIDPIASFANILALLMVKRAGLPIRKAIMLQLLVGMVAFLPALL